MYTSRTYYSLTCSLKPTARMRERPDRRHPQLQQADICPISISCIAIMAVYTHTVLLSAHDSYDVTRQYS